MAATGERCRDCGATLAPDARFCARCGRRRGEDASPTIVDLSPLHPVAAPVEQRALVATRPPDRRRALPAAAAVALLAVAALGLATLLDEDPTADAGAAPASTTEVLRDVPASTGVTTTSVTTTSAPAPTTTIAYVDQERGLVLDESQRYRSLYLAAGSTLYRVELDSGRVTARTGLGGLIGGQLAVADGRVFLAGGNYTSIAADLSGDLAFVLAPPGYAVFSPVAIQDRAMWFVRYDAAGTHLRRVDATGRTIDEQLVDAGLSFMGLLGDRVVVAQGGRIWLFGPGDRRVAYARGSVGSVTSRFVLWLGCEEDAHCTYRLGDATTADTGRTSLATSDAVVTRDAGGGSTLAPDGAGVLSWQVRGTGRPTVVDLETGALRDLPDPNMTAFGWSPDGRWLVTVSGGVLGCLDVRTGVTRVLKIPGYTGAVPVALGIG